MDYTESSYEEIEKVVEDLLYINPDNLDGEALNNQKIFPKISRIYIQKSRKLMDLTKTMAKLEHKRRRYYSGKESAEIYKKEPLTEAILKSDVDNYMAIDPLVVEMRGLVKECEMIVKFLEESKGQLRSRGFDIKNSIEYRKMMLGA